MEQKNESKKEVLICNWDSTGWKYNGGRGKRKIKENFFLIGKKKKKKKNTWKLKPSSKRTRKRDPLSFGRATRDCQTNGIGTQRVLRVYVHGPQKHPWPWVCFLPPQPHMTVLHFPSIYTRTHNKSHRKHKYVHPSYIFTSPHNNNWKKEEERNFSQSSSSLLSLITRTSSSLGWPSENQTSCLKRLWLSKFSRDARAWGRNKATMNKDSL